MSSKEETNEICTWCMKFSKKDTFTRENGRRFCPKCEEERRLSNYDNGFEWGHILADKIKSGGFFASETFFAGVEKDFVISILKSCAKALQDDESGWKGNPFNFEKVKTAV